MEAKILLSKLRESMGGIRSHLLYYSPGPIVQSILIPGWVVIRRPREPVKAYVPQRTTGTFHSATQSIRAVRPGMPLTNESRVRMPVIRGCRSTGKVLDSILKEALCQVSLILSITSQAYYFWGF